MGWCEGGEEGETEEVRFEMGFRSKVAEATQVRGNFELEGEMGLDVEECVDSVYAIDRL